MNENKQLKVKAKEIINSKENKLTLTKYGAIWYIVSVTTILTLLKLNNNMLLSNSDNPDRAGQMVNMLISIITLSISMITYTYYNTYTINTTITAKTPNMTKELTKGQLYDDSMFTIQSLLTRVLTFIGIFFGISIIGISKELSGDISTSQLNIVVIIALLIAYIPYKYVSDMLEFSHIVAILRMDTPKNVKKQVRKIYHKNIVTIYKLKLSYTLWNLLNIFTLGISSLYVTPYKRVSYTLLWKELTK